MGAIWTWFKGLFSGTDGTPSCMDCRKCCQTCPIPPTWPNENDPKWVNLPIQFKNQVEAKIQTHGPHQVGHVRAACVFDNPNGCQLAEDDLWPDFCKNWPSTLVEYAHCCMYRHDEPLESMEAYVSLDDDAMEAAATAYLDAHGELEGT